MKIMADLYLGLVHYPIYNKHMKVIATAVTNFDIHDIARTARTYDVKKYFLLFNFSASFAIIIFYGSLLLDDDMTSLSTVFIKILYILEFISVLSLEYDVKKGNWFIFLVNLLFVVTIIVTRSKNNVKNVTSILNKKRKFRGYNKIISFVKSQNGELLSDEKLVSFIYFFNRKIYGIYQFKKLRITN